MRLLASVHTDLDALASGEGLISNGTPPLEGMESVAGTAFAHWVDAMRGHCIRAARRMLANELETARDQGRIDRVQEHATALYRVDPFSNPAANALAEQMLVDGDRPGAITLLRQHIERLVLEFGQAPAGIQRRLRRIETEGPDDAEGFTATEAWPTSGPEFLVGRDDELAGLEALWTRAQRGTLTTAAIYGPPGIGKTSVLRHFCRSVEDRAWPVYLVSCQEIGYGIPFAATSELIHALLKDPAVGGTDPMWLAEASRVAPGLRARYPGVPEAPPVPAESVRLRVAESLVRMLDETTDGGPVLIAIDDVHQMDPTSRAVLHVLVRRLEGRAVLFVVTVQTPAIRPLVPPPDDLLANLPWIDELNLSPLAPARVTEWLTSSQTQTPQLPWKVVDTIIRMSEGNPYLVEMLLSDWQRDPRTSLAGTETDAQTSPLDWEPPETMRRAFTRQYQGLDRDAERVLGLLAVAGRKLGPSRIREALSLEMENLDRAVLELATRGILHVSGGDIGFKNNVHRRFLYWVIDPNVRRYYHERVGHFLLGESDDEHFQEQLEAAHHFLAAGDHDAAVGAAIAGSKQAIESGAGAEAERCLAAVLPHCKSRERTRLHLEMAKANAALGRYEDALAQITHCDEHHLTPSEGVAYAIVQAECLHRGRLANDKSITRAAQSALERAETDGTTLERLRAIQLLAEAGSDQGSTDALLLARQLARRVGESDTSHQTRSIARMTDGYCLLMLGQHKDAARVFEKLARDLSEAARDLDLRRALNGLGLSLTALGELPGAIEAFSSSAQIAARISDLDAQANAWSNLGAVYDDFGLFAESASAYSNALATIEQGLSGRRAAEVCINSAGLAITLQDSTSASELIRTAADLARQTQLWRLLVDVLLLQADYHLALSETELALQCFQEAEHLRGGRSYPLGNSGRYERLARYYHWRTEGYHGVERRNAHASDRENRLQLGDELEVVLFEAWIAQREGVDTGFAQSALQQLRELRLVGVLANLLALGFCPPGVEPPRKGESTPELAWQFFSPGRVPTIPKPPVLPPSGA